MSAVSRSLPAMAGFGQDIGRDLVEVSDDPDVLDTTGRWAVVQTFEGGLRCARFANWSHAPAEASEVGVWSGPGKQSWRTSLSRDAFLAGVGQIRAEIAAGSVYQVNLCRTISAELKHPGKADPVALAQRIQSGNPAPFAGFLRLPNYGVVTASPELFLARDGAAVHTGPIKGTGLNLAAMGAKDHAENIMIVDLMRNDLAKICEPGSIQVPRLVHPEEHPGLVHLVSDIIGNLRPGASWRQIFQALAPAGSVSGAPKQAALGVIQDLEPAPRGPYCGVIGWVDADNQTARLAVGIRTFWLESGPMLRFGTGAGITWGSDPESEWEETELKARRLLSLAQAVG
ncbi:anthranilate synthase component I family protein [Candidatus Nanopelagicales bacterium]|nr:anthranilate synthase component I family protein [Candidatus Nanopelagicales bacterium]